MRSVITTRALCSQSNHICTVSGKEVRLHIYKQPIGSYAQLTGELYKPKQDTYNIGYKPRWYKPTDADISLSKIHII